MCWVPTCGIVEGGEKDLRGAVERQGQGLNKKIMFLVPSHVAIVWLAGGHGVLLSRRPCGLIGWDGCF
jgi:hypothetical protein